MHDTNTFNLQVDNTENCFIISLLKITESDIKIANEKILFFKHS